MVKMMATKNIKLLSKELPLNLSTDNGNQYSNLNLNQNFKCSMKTDIQSKNISKFNNHFNDFTVAKNGEENGSFKAWNKSKINSSLKSFNLFNQEEKEGKKRWENEGNKSSNNTNNSTLSLHIAAYENSIEFLNETDSLKSNEAKSWDLKNSLQNSFEIPRQMDGNNSTTPQVMQFKASQKLLQPNQSLPQNSQEQKSRGIGTNEKSRVAINTMNQAPPSSRQLSSRASGQYAEMADTTIHRSDRPIREVENNNSLSGEGLSIRSNKKINPAVVKALEEIKAWFHGKMDRFKASKLLKKDGDFLVRLGKSMDDLLYKPVLSVKWGQRHYHFLIKEQNSLFWIEKSQFGSIASLIRHNLHTKKPVTQHSGVILSTPILSSKFNPGMARSERDKRMSERDLRNSEGRNGVLEATRSLSYAVFGENAPFILQTLGKVAILCTVITFLWICTVF